MGRYNRYWRTTSRDITVYTDEVINDIPTKDLEDELEERINLRHDNPEQFKKEERWRDGEANVSIDLDEYNLVDTDDLDPGFFDKDTLINYLENIGYAVFDKTFTDISNVANLHHCLLDMSKWKRKEYICDILGLNHFATIDDITNEIKNLLN